MRQRYDSLSDFITELEKSGELRRVKEEVSPILEITEITDRESKLPGGGKALLFENVEGSSLPLLINAYGSENRINSALGGPIEDIATRISDLINMKPPTTLGEKLSVLKTLFDIGKYIPKTIKRDAPCQEVVCTDDDINLYQFPILKCWPLDAGRFITFPVVFTKGLYDGKRNVGMYRMQVYDKKTTGMHWHIHKDGATHFDEYRKEGKRMEVAVAIGTDPVVTYAATAPMPPGVDELMLAGFIRQKGIRLVKCKTVDLSVPADAEIVLEGYVQPDEIKEEGPFGDHTGYYSMKGFYPVFHITAITHRRNPTYFTTIVGKPPMEDCYLGKATERIFLPMLKMVNPEVTDLSMPWEGVFHNCVIVSMSKRYPMHARKLMSSLWGTGQMSFAKMILMTDTGIDIQNYEETARLMLNRIDLERDLVISEGVLDVLDHSSPDPLYGAKLGIDATAEISGEKPRKSTPVQSSDIRIEIEDIREILTEAIALSVPLQKVKNPVLLISIAKKGPFHFQDTAKKLWDSGVIELFKITVFFDKDVDVSSTSFAIWRFFNNVDARRDFLLYKGCLSVDATKKLKEEGYNRDWPDDIIMDKEVVEKVNRMAKSSHEVP